MKIRDKILVYFSTTVISLTIISSAILYFLFSGYREEEFQKRQKQNLELTIRLLSDYKELNEELISKMGESSIHDLYDEKVMIFDKNKSPTFKSIDNLFINKYKEILDNLSPSQQWFETKEGKYDLIGVYIENKEDHFYAISKAYDEFGYSKLDFLRNILILLTLSISIIVLIISYYLSNKISKPITSLAEELSHIKIDNEHFNKLEISATNSYELIYLTQKFNELIKRTNEAFSFQKHAVQHISHELKTPLAVLVSELEKAKDNSNIEAKNQIITEQIEKSKKLGEIINALLEISKIESGQKINRVRLRADELIYELIESKSLIHPEFQFEVRYEPELSDEWKLSLNANKILLTQAFSNLLDNCIKYSSNERAQISFECSDPTMIKMSFGNTGKTPTESELQFLFSPFFRSKENQSVQGIGLGLVLVKKIIEIHQGKISYHRTGDNYNLFKVTLPLS